MSTVPSDGAVISRVPNKCHHYHQPSLCFVCRLCWTQQYANWPCWCWRLREGSQHKNPDHKQVKECIQDHMASRKWKIAEVAHMQFVVLWLACGSVWPSLQDVSVGRCYPCGTCGLCKIANKKKCRERKLGQTFVWKVQILEVKMH